jgi:transcriptional regulator with XRE-family HTH domain
MSIAEITKPYTGALAQSVGGQIRLIRKLKGMTLNELALKCRSTPQTIQRLEVGNMTLSLDWVETICNALEILPRDLFSDEDRGMAAQIEIMRTEAEVLKIRALDFVGRIDGFLRDTE